MFFCPANTQQSPRLPPDLWRSGSRDGYHGEGHLPEQMVQLPDIGPGETDPDTPPRGSVAGLRYHSHLFKIYVLFPETVRKLYRVVF